MSPIDIGWIKCILPCCYGKEAMMSQIFCYFIVRQIIWNHFQPNLTIFRLETRTQNRDMRSRLKYIFSESMWDKCFFKVRWREPEGLRTTGFKGAQSDFSEFIFFIQMMHHNSSPKKSCFQIISVKLVNLFGWMHEEIVYIAISFVC